MHIHAFSPQQNTKAIIAQKYPLFSNYRISSPSKCITFWKAWVFELHHQLLTVKFNKETGHRNKLLLASGSQFLSTGTHISDGAFKGWKYDPIWLPNKHFLNKSIATEVKHRMSQSISVYVVTAHRNGYKTNCIIDPPLPTNIGLVDHD